MLSQPFCCPCSLCPSPYWCQGVRMLLMQLCILAPILPQPQPFLWETTQNLPLTSLRGSQEPLASFPIHKQPWQVPSPPWPSHSTIGGVPAGVSPLPAPEAEQDTAPKPTPKTDPSSNSTSHAEGLME